MELTSNTDTHWRSEELFFCLELRSTTDTHWPSEELFFWLWNDLNFGNLLLAVPLNVLPNNKEYRYYGMVLCSMVWYFIDHWILLLCGRVTYVAEWLFSLTVWPNDWCGPVTVWPSGCVAERLCGQVTVWPSDCVAERLCGRVTMWPGGMWPSGMWPSVMWPSVCEPFGSSAMHKLYKCPNFSLKIRFQWIWCIII